MTEQPDFDRIADMCLARVYESRSQGLIAEHAVVVEALRQVWNARGDADCAAVAANVSGSDWYVRRLSDALKALDQ